MERFAFKIDSALRANLYKICRLCGMDNTARIPILEKNDQDNVIEVDGEPKLSEKIRDLIGFRIYKNDKMPQTMCSLCLDKINDFYEFREMCYATNVQTRKLLGLKPEEPEKAQKIDVKPVVSVKEEHRTEQPNKRGRKRKSEEVCYSVPNTELDLHMIKKEKSFPKSKKKRACDKKLQSQTKTEIKNEPLDATGTSGCANKQRKPCPICGERFENIEKLKQHKVLTHVPCIPRYICNACDQTHYTSSHIKAHQLWHKLSKAPYKCPLCDASIPNFYSFTRHMREHSQMIPVTLQVFDRECPQCKGTFATNFLYNTHRCAIRTKKCGGCNRYQRSDVEFVRHAAYCPKMYLTHTKHIPSGVTAMEDFVRIKNENDIEAAVHNEIDMQPFVSLERISSPMLRAAISGSADEPIIGKAKTGKKDSTKNYLKRVDQLLKSTIDTLVSIKHEPEVHVEADEPPVVAVHESNSDNELPCDEAIEHFRDASDNESETEHETSTVASQPAIGVVQEKENDAEKPISVKQEIIDDSYQQQQTPSIDLAESMPIKQETKPFALKLKITMDNGQLNSLLIDDEDSIHPGKKRKKKKRKDNEKMRQKEQLPANIEDGVVVASTQMKEELIDTDYNLPEDNQSAQLTAQPETTFMTSIPMDQFEISCRSNGAEVGQTYGTDSERSLPIELARVATELEDVKPNCLELDRLMQITKVLGGVDMEQEAMAEENTVSDNIEANSATIPAVNTVMKTVRTGGIARKSTSAAQTQGNKTILNETLRRDTVSHKNAKILVESTPNNILLPQIVAVESTTATAFEDNANVVIKEEPCNRGYADEAQSATTAELEPMTMQEQHHNNVEVEKDAMYEPYSKEAAEKAYIESIDFNNIYIKQEKEIHLYDMPPNDIINGLANESDDSGDDNDDDDDDGESRASDCSAEEVREYRELDLPLEYQEPNEANDNENPVEDSKPTTMEFVISNVCSQAQMALPEVKDTATENKKCSASEEVQANTQEAFSNPTDIISVSINAEKDLELQALPICDLSNETNNDIAQHNSDSEEEQQNMLNHELSDHNQRSSSSSVATTEAAAAEASCAENEETENRINELQQQAQQHQQLQPPHPPYHQVLHPHLNDSNINEIAENNNNANIERELLDDANNLSAEVAPQNNDYVRN